MKKISEFLFENFHFLVVNFSIYLNRHVFVMLGKNFSRSHFHYFSPERHFMQKVVGKVRPCFFFFFWWWWGRGG